MSVKRVKDPAGLLPDLLHVHMEGQVTKQDVEAIWELLTGASPQGRIARLRKFPALQATADALEARLVNGAMEVVVDGKHRIDSQLDQDIRNAEYKALYLAAESKVMRDNKRQAGTRKARSKRNPEVDKWIDHKLKARPDAKAPELFQQAPGWLTDIVKIDRFAKRVTAARKRARSHRN